MSSVATVAAWLLFALPAAAAVTIVGSRLLGTRRGLIERLVAGRARVEAGLVIAGVLTSWHWSDWDMVLLTLLFGTLLTMVIAVGLDMLAAPGSLLRDESRVGPHLPRAPRARPWRSAVAPVGRYRQLVSIARANGMLARPPRSADPDAWPPSGRPAPHPRAGRRHVREARPGGLDPHRPPARPSCATSSRCCARRRRPAPADQVQALIEDELGAPVTEVFAAFDWEPMASRLDRPGLRRSCCTTAPTSSSRSQRPGIDEVIERDSAVLRQMAGGLERHTTLGLTLKPTELADEFIVGIRDELDFNIEAANAARPRRRHPGRTRRVAVPARLRRPLDRPGCWSRSGSSGVSITDVDDAAGAGPRPGRAGCDRSAGHPRADLRRRGLPRRPPPRATSSWSPTARSS